jgi:hypothetical protein
MDLGRLFVIAVLLAIVGTLGSALFRFSRGGDDSGRMLRSLTWRVGLSVFLFLLLMLAWKMGYIHPHAVQPGQIQ